MTFADDMYALPIYPQHIILEEFYNLKIKEQVSNNMFIMTKMLLIRVLEGSSDIQAYYSVFCIYEKRSYLGIAECSRPILKFYCFFSFQR